MNKVNEWNLFALQRGIVPAICAEFDQIFHTSNAESRDHNIFEFIRGHATNNIEALLAAAQRDALLKSYCVHQSMQPFWNQLERQEQEVSAYEDETNSY